MKRRAVAGFTLLEVLVALAILAIGLAAAVRIGASSGANAIYLRDKTFAQWVGANRITELQLQSAWPEVGTQRGRSTMGPKEWLWRARISETPDSRIRRVDIEVGPAEQEDTVMATLTAFLPQTGGASP